MGSGEAGVGGAAGPRTIPRPEYHFMQGVQRLTNIDAAAEGKLVRPLDDELFEHPWLYAVEVGTLASAAGGGRTHSRVLVTGRFPDGRRLSWHLRMGKLPGKHAAGFPGTADSRDRVG